MRIKQIAYMDANEEFPFRVTIASVFFLMLCPLLFQSLILFHSLERNSIVFFFAIIIKKFSNSNRNTHSDDPLTIFIRLIMRYMTTLLSTVCLFELDTDE